MINQAIEPMKAVKPYQGKILDVSKYTPFIVKDLTTNRSTSTLIPIGPNKGANEDRLARAARNLGRQNLILYVEGKPHPHSPKLKSEEVSIVRENKLARKPVINLTTGEYFKNSADAARAIGVSGSTITVALREKKPTGSGFTFRAATPEEIEAGVYTGAKVPFYPHAMRATQNPMIHKGRYYYNVKELADELGYREHYQLHSAIKRGIVDARPATDEEIEQYAYERIAIYKK